jgi:hypothetical protein
VAEIAREHAQGYPADSSSCRHDARIHRYFEFPKNNKMAVGLAVGIVDLLSA